MATDPQTPSAPLEGATSPTDQLLAQRFQNYFNLRNRLNTEITRQAGQLARPLVTSENLPLLIETAAQTVSQRSIKFLPKKDALTREDISSALVTAFDELARKQDWLDSALSRKKRKELAASVAKVLETTIPQDSLQQALAERRAYTEEVQKRLGDPDEVVTAVQTDLQQASIEADAGKKIAEEISQNLDRKALHLGASPTPVVTATVGIALERHAPDLSEEERLAASLTLLQGEGGKKLQARYEAVGEVSDDINALLKKHKTFSKIVREEIEKDAILSIADETRDRKPTIVHLKEPLLLGKNKDIEVRKLELYNRTREADPNLPPSAAMPLFRFGTRVQQPKTANLNAVDSFTIFDPETKKRVTVTKDRLDLRALQKIDKRAHEKLSFLFDEKNLKGFEKTYRWLKNPTGETLRLITRPVTSRVSRGVNTLSKPVRDLVRGITAPLRSAVQQTTATVKTAVGKVTTPVRQAVGKAIGFITSPVKKATQKLAMKGVQLAAKALIKIGLGGVVKKIEQLALAGSVVGIPILIAQELITRGLGKLGKTAKKLVQDWKQVFREGLQDPIRGSIRFIGTGVDTLGAGIGGITVGAIGTAGGALLGAAIGSLVPVIGTIIGGIVGGVAGGIFGAGYGAKQGYELRRKIQKKILIFLGMKALGLNPFKIAWALFKAGGIYLLGKVAPFLQTLLSRAVTGARGLFGIARYGTQVLAQQVAAGEGLFAQALRGIGNLLGKIPSAIARGFNTATGWISSTTVNTAGTIESVTSEVLTAGPGSSLPLYSVLGTLGVIAVFAGITYTILIAVFHVTPTEVIPFVEARALGSRYIGITKVACVGALCSEDSLQLENASTAGPYTIQYTITVEALDGTLTNVRITDTYAAYGDNNPPTPPPEEWDGGLTIPDGTTWEQTLTLTIPRSSQWNDAALTNVVTVTGNVQAEAEPVQNSDSIIICFGDCPICPPTLSPLDSPKISGYKFGNAPTNVCLNPDIEHRGIDLGSPSLTIYSSFACPAVVEYVADTSVGLGTYMVLRSGPWYAFYAHLVSGSYMWNAGDVITGRQPIGIMDSTGNSTGNHLHYEIRDETLGGVNPSDHCEPPVSVNPCSWDDWGVGDAQTCAI